MNKQQIIEQLHKYLLSKGGNYQKWEIREVIEPFLTIILNELKQGNNINITHFGKFVVKHHKSRPYYNINKGEMDSSMEKKTNSLKPHKENRR